MSLGFRERPDFGFREQRDLFKIVPPPVLDGIKSRRRYAEDALASAAQVGSGHLSKKIARGPWKSARRRDEDVDTRASLAKEFDNENLVSKRIRH